MLVQLYLLGGHVLRQICFFLYIFASTRAPYLVFLDCLFKQLRIVLDRQNLEFLLTINVIAIEVLF